MKKTAKTLLGVLSIGALVGTGYAMWHVSGGFVGAETELTPGIETEVDKNFGLIEVTPLDGDNTINFDGVLDEDLTVKYTVKALANEGSSRDPYDLTNYDGVAEEYIPNLKITTIAKDDVGELSVDDEFFNYVKLPEVQVVDYKTWLDSTCKDNGYAVTLTFSWSDELDNQNPELAWKGLTVEEQEANFNSLIKALEGVKFTFKFEVGNKVDEPTVDETSEITLPTVEGSTLTIEGMKEGTISAGTHAVTLEVTEENKVLKDSKVFVTYSDAEGIVGNDEIILTAQNSRAIYETYVGEYTFKANFKYSFSYELVDNVPESEIKTFYFKDVQALNAWGSKGYLYAWNSVSDDKNLVWPGEEIKQISWNVFDDNANIYVGQIDVAKYDYFIFNTTDSNGNSLGQTRNISISELGENDFVMLTTPGNEGNYEVEFANYSTLMEEKQATINLDFNGEGGKVSYEEKTYYNNDVVTLNIEPAEGYTIGEVTLGDTAIEPTEGVYSFTVKAGENNVKVSFVNSVVNYSIAQITEAGNAYTVRGVIAAKDNNSLLIHDGTDGILAYDRNLTGNVGDYVTISGGTSEYNGLLQFSYSNNPAVTIDETLTEVGPSLPEAKELTDETLNTLTTASLSTKDVQLYKWRATCGTLGNYKTLNLNGSEINIEPTSSQYLDSLVEGYEYDVEAYFIGYNKSNNYVSVMLASEPKLVEVNATSVTINAEKTTIMVGESLELTYSTDPLNSTNTVHWASSDDQIVSIDDKGKITGIAEGEVEIILELRDQLGNVTTTSSLTILVSGVSDTGLYNYTYEPDSGVYTENDLTIEFDDFILRYDFSSCSTKLKEGNGYSSLRIYGKAAVTLTSKSYKIKQITIKYSDGSSYEKPLTVNEELYAVSDIIDGQCIISCLEENGNNEVVFNNNNSSQVRISGIDIEYNL